MKPETTKVNDNFYKLAFDRMINGLAYCQMIFDEHGQPVDFIYIRVNGAFEHLTGLKNVVGKKVTKVIPGIRDSNPELIQAYGRVSLTGHPEKFETHIESLKKWFLVSAYSPKKNFFMAIFEETTNKKNLEKSLAKDLEDVRMATLNVLEDLQIEKEMLAHAKAKDEAMLSSIGDGLIIIDPNAKITFMNEVGKNLLGLDSAELVGKSLFDAFVAQDEKGNPVPRETRPMTIAMRTGMTIVQEGKESIAPKNKFIAGVFYYVRKDKTKFPVAITVAPVIFENKIVGAIEVFRDITREREIDREKSEFVSLASHQLKTPPTAIKLLTERLLNNRLGTFNPEQREYINNIRSSNQRMIDIINALLSVSRIELGKFIIDPLPKDVCAIIKGIVVELQSLIHIQKIQVKESYVKDSVIVPVDEILFHTVIINVIMNAIYYTGQHGTVRVECKEMEKGQMFGKTMLKENYFTVIISDNGYGIPESQQNKIFTKFFRADNARSAHTDGTGLGLYIVKSILDNCGGLIWFLSKEHEGTTFYIAIPMIGMKAREGTKQLI